MNLKRWKSFIFSQYGTVRQKLNELCFSREKTGFYSQEKFWIFRISLRSNFCLHGDTAIPMGFFSEEQCNRHHSPVAVTWEGNPDHKRVKQWLVSPTMRRRWIMLSGQKSWEYPEGLQTLSLFPFILHLPVALSGTSFWNSNIKLPGLHLPSFSFKFCLLIPTSSPAIFTALG